MGEATRAGTKASKLKLMVVDDEIDNLDLLYRTFRRDFDVFQASSGLDALALLAQVGEMGIIISDQRMPHMSGTEFLSCTVDRFPDTIRILLTGYTDVEDLVGAINAGQVFKYITKPWDSNELMAIVQQAAETYRVVKQRTNELNRALQRESLFNTIMTAIRGSLDYGHMLQTIVETMGHTFSADVGILYPIGQMDQQTSCPYTPESFLYQADQSATSSRHTHHALCNSDQTWAPPESIGEMRQTIDAHHGLSHLIVPLTYQQEQLATLILSRQSDKPMWSEADLQLMAGVAEQAALAISQAKLHQQIQIQTQQMRAELAVARQIQMNLLRQSWEPLDRVRIQAHCYPAREVGGDFFEVYVHPQGDVWLAVGDVSGKGVPAALFMASAISLLRRELSQETPPDPNVVLQRLNHSLWEDLVSCNCFITMVLARYTPATHDLIYANAGHIYPLIWSQPSSRPQANRGPQLSTADPTLLKTRGVPLGILSHWQAAAGQETLKAGDVLLLTSDGITEATVVNAVAGPSCPGAMLQQTGLCQLLCQYVNGLDLQHLLTTIQALSPIQEDDQTLLSLEVLE